MLRTVSVLVLVSFTAGCTVPEFGGTTNSEVAMSDSEVAMSEPPSEARLRVLVGEGDRPSADVVVSLWTTANVSVPCEECTLRIVVTENRDGVPREPYNKTAFLKRADWTVVPAWASDSNRSYSYYQHTLGADVFEKLRVYNISVETRAPDYRLTMHTAFVYPYGDETTFFGSH